MFKVKYNFSPNHDLFAVEIIFLRFKGAAYLELILIELIKKVNRVKKKIVQIERI